MKYILASLIVLIIGFSGFLNPVRDIVVNLVSPIQFGLTKIAYNLKDAFGFFSNVTKVREENLSLIKQLRDSQEEITKLKQVMDENTLLKSQLGLKMSSSLKIRSIIAEVMGNADDLSGGTVFINKGTRDGVRVNDMAVIGKSLVGTVKNVEYSRSTVELITSSNISFTAYDIDSQDKTEALAEGKHSSVLQLSRILPSEKVTIGDTFVTSGKDGLFLPNYVVGKITDIQDDPSQPLKEANVQTILDFSKITEVFVIQVMP